MNTNTIPLEDIQFVTSCFVYVALIPLFLISPIRNNPARFVFSNLEYLFDAQRITPHEFGEHGNYTNRPNQQYFKFEAPLELQDFKDTLEKLLREYGYQIFASFLFDYRYSIQMKRKGSYFQIEIIPGSLEPNSFRVTVVQLFLA